MSNRVALDTSIVIQIFRQDPQAAERFRALDSFWLPAPVVAEMHIGFESNKLSAAALKAREEFTRFTSQSTIIDCTREVAEKYARIYVSLPEKGQMIPQNDIWIAACCLIANAPLATRDAHFQCIPELTVKMW